MTTGKGRTQMADWEREIGAMTLLVADLGRSKQFYQDAFGLTAQYEDADSVMFRFNGMYVFLRNAPVAEGPPADFVLELALAGAGQFAIIVADVDAVCAELAERGVTVLSGPSDRDWGMRTVTFADPNGHVWEIAQPLPSD
jgi:catechol 2,3-dioxygenase-like lactoylglutathione lyase family enzyme